MDIINQLQAVTPARLIDLLLIAVANRLLGKQQLSVSYQKKTASRPPLCLLMNGRVFFLEEALRVFGQP
jgi:hypothetical protein